jgi:hypothetical protein
MEGVSHKSSVTKRLVLAGIQIPSESRKVIYLAAEARTEKAKVGRAALGFESSMSVGRIYLYNIPERMNIYVQGSQATPVLPDKTQSLAAATQNQTSESSDRSIDRP